MAALLEAEGLRVGVRDLEIVSAADLVVEAGTVVSLVGPNGAGKSTVARTVAGLQKPSGGRVEWNGEPIAELGGRRLARVRAFVPQHAPVPGGMTVREAVDIGRAPHVGTLRRPTQADRDIARHAIARVGARHMVDRTLTTLSGGELQRVRVAVALAQQAPCLILDEPTSALDLGASARLGRLLRDLADDEGLGVLVVLQDLALAAAISDQVVVMHGGRTVAAGPPSEVLTSERLAEIWRVDAQLTVNAGQPGTALHIDWLAPPPAARDAEPLEADA